MRGMSGFTIIELLVVLSLMAIISLISWRGLDSIQRASESISDRTADTLALVRALGQLELDVSQHAGPDILLSGGHGQPGIYIRENSLEMVRLAANGYGWQRVRWYLEGNVLRRAIGPQGRKLPLEDINYEVSVLESVQAFRVRAWLPSKGWVKLDALGDMTATGLEVVVERRGRGGNELYRKVIFVP